MKNYFIRYSNYFITLGAILLVMYFANVVPWRLRNVPELIRWLLPVLFLLAGIAGKFLNRSSE